jgi:glutathione peroxidase-family protein
LLNKGAVQFGGQAPGSSEEERAAAIKKFGFEFDVMDKLDVNGDRAHPLYRYLRRQQPKSVPKTARTPPGSLAIEWCEHPFLRGEHSAERVGPAAESCV